MPCRFLATTPLADMASTVKSTCGSDWAATTQDCAQLDLQRNCIFATAGHVFKRKTYKAAFASQPWYKPNPAFRDADLSKVAINNVAALKDEAAACKKGQTLSAADHKIVDAWLATVAAGQPEIPAIVGGNVDMDREQMVAFFKDDDNKRFYVRRNLATARYVEPQPGDATSKATTRAKVIELAFAEPSTQDCPEEDYEECGSGHLVELAVDAAGKLVALSREFSACPIAYLVTPAGEVLQGELLQNIVGAQHEATQTLRVAATCSEHQVYRVREEKDEVTYLDSLALMVDGEMLAPDGCRGALCANDGVKLALARGDSVDVAFTIPPGLRCDRVALVANGYYVPHR